MVCAEGHEFQQMKLVRCPKYSQGPAPHATMELRWRIATIRKVAFAETAGRFGELGRTRLLDSDVGVDTSMTKCGSGVCYVNMRP